MKTIQAFSFDNYIFMLLYRSIIYGNNGYGNNGYGVGGRGYGSNNGRMSQMNQTRHRKTRRNPVEVIVDKIMETLKELVLDQLQEIAISNVLKSVRSQGILLKAETTQEQKKKKSKNQALSEVTDRKVNNFE
jgi:hypothetical protein